MRDLAKIIEDFNPEDVVIVAKKSEGKRGSRIKDKVRGYIAYKDKDKAYFYASLEKDYAQGFLKEGWGFNLGKFKDNFILVYQENGWKISTKQEGKRYGFYVNMNMLPDIRAFLNGMQRQNCTGISLDARHIMLVKEDK